MKRERTVRTLNDLDTVGCWRAQGTHSCPQGRPKGSFMLDVVDLRRVVTSFWITHEKAQSVVRVFRPLFPVCARDTLGIQRSTEHTCLCCVVFRSLFSQALRRGKRWREPLKPLTERGCPSMSLLCSAATSEDNFAWWRIRRRSHKTCFSIAQMQKVCSRLI